MAMQFHDQRIYNETHESLPKLGHAGIPFLRGLSATEPYGRVRRGFRADWSLKCPVTAAR